MLLRCIPQPGTACSKKQPSPTDTQRAGLFSRLFRRQLGFVTLYKLDQAEAQHTADVSQLNKVKPAQATLNVACERLRAAKCLGELPLSQARLDTALSKQAQQHQVLVSVYRFFHGEAFQQLTKLECISTLPII